MIDLGKLPNLRRLIIPDEGFTIIDMDLERADTWVVAKDSKCERLMGRLRTENIHSVHAREFFSSLTEHTRLMSKKLCHAANYLVGVRKASYDTGLSERKILEFLEYWFTTYPEIKTWHESIKQALYVHRQVKNAFGYRKPLFDRIDNSLPEFVAWIPQSTVGITINKAMDNIRTSLPAVAVLLQVHDSLTLQVETGLVSEQIPLIREQSLIPIPYPDPLIIPVSFKTSELSWGDVKDYSLGLKT